MIILTENKLLITILELVDNKNGLSGITTYLPYYLLL